jgi:hypothetical protein
MRVKLLKEIEQAGGALYEGDFSKLITISDEYDDTKLFNVIETLAQMGWLLSNIHYKKGKTYYWFQSKRKIYANQLNNHE